MPTVSNDRAYQLPPLGQNPSTHAQGTTPGSFANPPRLFPGRAGALTFSSPDTPGMPGPSEKTAWDFMPAEWTLLAGFGSQPGQQTHEQAAAWQPPAGLPRGRVK